MKTATTVFLTWGLVIYSSALTLEEGYERCKGIPREEVESCTLKLIEDLGPIIAEGIPELGITTDDVVMGDLVMEEKSGDNYIAASFFANKIRGFLDLQLQKLEIDYDKHTAHWELLMPELFDAGRYTMDAQILFFPLKGTGNCWFLWKNMHVVGDTEFTVMEKDGDLRLQLVDTTFDFNYENITGRLNNLFDGDPLLSEAGAAFVNQNLDLMVDVLRPSIQKSFLPIVGKDLNVYLGNIDFENIIGKEFIKEAFNLKK